MPPEAFAQASGAQDFEESEFKMKANADSNTLAQAADRMDWQTVTLFFKRRVNECILDGGVYHWLAVHPHMRGLVVEGNPHFMLVLVRPEGVDVLNAAGRTPLYHALLRLVYVSKTNKTKYHHLLRYIRALTVQGAQWDLVDENGETPRELALALLDPRTQINEQFLELNRREMLHRLLVNLHILRIPLYESLLRLLAPFKYKKAYYWRCLQRIRNLHPTEADWNTPHLNGETPRELARRLLDLHDQLNGWQRSILRAFLIEQDAFNYTELPRAHRNRPRARPLIPQAEVFGPLPFVPSEGQNEACEAQIPELLPTAPSPQAELHEPPMLTPSGDHTHTLGAPTPEPAPIHDGFPAFSISEINAAYLFMLFTAGCF